MTRAAATCVVCHHPRTEGSFSDNGEFFVCSRCQSDAKQFLKIQDDIWPPTTKTHAASEESDDRSDP